MSKASGKKKVGKKNQDTMKGSPGRKSSVNKPADRKGAGGRPSSYKPEYGPQAEKLCLLGAIDMDLADFFGVSEQTLNTWKKRDPEFLESLKRGKTTSDSKVVNSLYHRAMGYTHLEEKVFCYNGKIIKTSYQKYFPPDTTACIFWLKNRDPENWREKQEHQISDADKTMRDFFKLTDTTGLPAAHLPPSMLNHPDLQPLDGTLKKPDGS